MMVFMRAAALFLMLVGSSQAAVSGIRGAQKVTPVEKVIELIKKLQGQIEEEAKTEATQYDKYACFCKEQSDDKRYAIEKSNKKIKKLAARIGELDAEIADLNGDIANSAKRVTELEGEIKEAVAVRAKEHAAYLAEAKDMDDAISALEGAIKALQDSKSQLTDAKLDFVQLRALATQVLTTVSRSSSVSPSYAQLNAVTALAKLGGPGEATVYEYQSNDIIATLQGLLVDFKNMKKELDENEFGLRSASEMKTGNLANEMKFAEKEKTEKEEVSAMKTDQMHQAQEDKDQETKERDADQSFLDVLVEACQTKAQEWDQRSRTRAGELAAIAQALEALESGVTPNWNANKKLAGLQLGAHNPITASGATSLLQVRGTNMRKQEIVTGRALQLISLKADTLKSRLLSALLIKAKASEDHFVKVRGLIKDLIARLEADAESEASQKSFCDREMASALSDLDRAQASLEELAAETARNESERAALLEDIDDLQKAIAELQKALNEATELRSTERDQNKKTLAEAEAGKEAVKFALQVLSEFYEGAAAGLVQYVPPDSDRDGKTVGDLAPEVFDGEYNGRQESSKGIIGLLEVILSDFERTITTVTAAEKEAQEVFEEFEVDTNADIAEKQKDKAAKEARVADITDKLAQLKDEAADAKSLLDGSLAELEKLKPMCVQAEETYAERVAKRDQEIEALKQAIEILDNWQN